ncbi:hypothetical protein FRX31_010348 [Thalictrum thalictroides]|uniref:Uncharacterized protein n=1 Tax=Thalictrum thalictroides TaxID=46969 RepID=A0A7J6WSR7_THATH|nr:hypothetical protein FRX31_010348 [Thalictrum thalictroides]
MLIVNKKVVYGETLGLKKAICSNTQPKGYCGTNQKDGCSYWCRRRSPSPCEECPEGLLVGGDNKERN